MSGGGPRANWFSAKVMPPNYRPTGSEYPGLAEPDIVWEDARWCRVVERNDLHEVRYLKITDDKGVAALATLLVTQKPGGLLFYDAPRLVGTPGSMAEPDILDPAEQRRWAELTATLPDWEQYPSLTLATFGSHHGVVHAPRRNANERGAVMAALPGLLRHAAAELGCRSSALLYVGQTDAADVDLPSSCAGYTAALLGAEGVYEVTHSSWEGHVAALTKRRRKRLLTELNDYAAAGFRTEIRYGADAISDDLVALQAAHRAKYGLSGGQERIRKEFSAIREELGESCVVLSAERDGQMAGFMLFFHTGHALYARTAGFAPDARGCYFALGYHETARWAVENGVRRIHYGLAAYEAKFARGCILAPRWGWFAFDGAKSEIYRQVLALQSRSIERRLELVGAPVTPVFSRSDRSTTGPAIEHRQESSN